MKIKEVANRTGLTEKTIRYYEEKGLITPEMEMVGKRRFREYTEENINDLEEIANLRRLFFTIEEIKTMKEQSTEIPRILDAYKSRMEEELKAKLQIANSLQSMELSKEDTIESIIHKITPKVEDLPLPMEDVNPDFGKLDRQNSMLNLLVDRRIYTKHSLFAKKVTDVEVFILVEIDKKNQMSFNDILHVCLNRGIKDQKYVQQVIKRMCHKKLLRMENDKYYVEAAMPKLTDYEVDRLVQGAATGSPVLFVYSPQQPSSVSGQGYN